MGLAAGSAMELVSQPVLGMLVPAQWLNVLGPVSLLLVGYLMYREFAGKLVTTLNVLAAHLFFLSQGGPTLIGIYLNIGLMFAAIAPFMGRTHDSQGQKVFNMVSWLYSSPVVAALILWTLV